MATALMVIGACASVGPSLSASAAEPLVNGLAVPCTSSRLAVTAGQSNAGLGHIGVPIELRNTGPVACWTKGYPQVAFVNAAGRVVAHARQTPSGYLGGLRTGNATPPLVTILPGKQASALVEGSNFNVKTGGSCPEYRSLLVTPPSGSRAVRVPLKFPGCPGIQVHPVVPGAQGLQ
jgi:hypothetical protein